MRHIKRFLAMLLSVLMFVSSIPVTAFADSQTETDLQEQKPPGLSLETELSEDGQTVTAMIKAGAYTNASALQFDLHFDAAKVSVTEENVTLGGLAQSMECLLSVNDGYLSVAGAVSSEETKTSTEEETILTAEFTVLEGAADDLLFSLSDLVYQGEEGIFQNADSQFGTTLSSAVTIPEPAREYMVTALPAENGNVTVSAESAAEGTEVGLTVNPDPEYRVRSLKVTYQDSDGTKEVAVTESNTFIMPAADVTVEAVFEGDSRLLSLEISEENGGINSYTLNPEFDKAGLEYELTIPDYLSYAYIRVQNKNVQDKIIAKYPTTFGFSYKTMTPDNWEYTQIGIKNLLTLKVGPDVSVSTFDSSVYPEVTTYAVKITRSATLTDLAMDGTVSPSKFDRSKTDYTAVIPGDAGTFKVTPKWNTSGYSVESGDLASDKPGEVLEFPVSWDSEGKMEIPVTVKAEGKLPTTYNITVFAEKHEDVPAVNANPEGGQSYIDTAAADKVTPLTVKASANGTLSYQWYQNTVDSNENGQIITGAAEDTYIPEITATDKTKITYYYCVVTNTNDSGTYQAASATASVTVKPDPTPYDIELKPVDGSEIPAEGYSYNVGDESVAVKAAFKTRAENGIDSGTVSYTWKRYRPNSSSWSSSGGSADTFQIPTDENSSRCIACMVNFTVDGVTYKAENTVRIPYTVSAKNVEAPVFTKHPENKDYLVGDELVKDLTYSVETKNLGDNSTKTFQWYRSEDGKTFKEVDSSKPVVLTEPGTNYYKVRATYSVESYDGETYSASADSDVAAVSFKTMEEMLAGEDLWEGKGTKEEPYLIRNLDNLNLLKKVVNEKGIALSGCFFKMDQDITLPDDWTPIGCVQAGQSYHGNGKYINPFSGTFDGGGHTLTVAKGGLPLFGNVRYATVCNLNLYGEEIAGYGLVNNYCVDYGPTGDYGKYTENGYPLTVSIENVTIKAGTSILKAGFIGGFASGANVVEIKNCTAEAGVIIGYDKNQTQIGTFAGNLSGTMENCVSYATVYGTSRVGGLVGSKGEAMGPSRVMNSMFAGTVEATGQYVGGIYGSGYTSTSAPNTPCVSVKNCYVTGQITGGNYVGGIVGAEPASLQCWANGAGYIQNNYFYGDLKATEEGGILGGVVAYMRSLDRYNIISNNYYLDTCGTTVAIAKADQIDTARKLESDTIKYVTTDSYCRTDDPLGADAGKLGQAATAEQFADGTVAEGLNAGEGSFENWEQGEKYPVYGDEPVVYVESLSVTGYKDTYTTLEEFTTEGTVVTAVMSDGTKTEVPVEDAEFSGYINSVGTWAVTVTYKGCMTSFSVKVKKATDEQYAEHVDGLIEAIGEVTADSKDAIDTARAAYDKLTAAQKELITKYEILTAAEETYENLMKQYDIHIAEAENGSITASPESAREGMEVLLTVKPDEGYKQKSLTVTYFDGDTEKNVSVSGGKFKMPAADVTVTAEFKEVSRLASLQFASDADGKHVYELTPSFDKKTLTYQLEAGVPEYLTKIYYKAVPEAASDKITLKYQEVWGTNVTAAAIDKWEIRTLSGNPVTMTYKVGEKALYAWTFDNAVYPDITPYTVVINRRATLANLTTDDSMRPAKFDPEQMEYAVSVPQDAKTYSFTPTGYSDSYTIEAAGVTAVSGQPVEIPVTWDENGQMKVAVSVSQEDLKTSTYTLTLLREKNENTPYITANPEGGQTYFDTVEKTDITPLNVKASADGDLTYQWYYNTTDHVQDGIRIEGAEEATYCPQFELHEKSTAYYYYCIVTNKNDSGTYSAVSETAKVTVKPDPTPYDVKVLPADGSELPEDGYVMNVGDTGPKLKVSYKTRAEGGVESGSVKYMWWTRAEDGTGSGNSSTSDTYTIRSAKNELGYVACDVKFTLDGVTYTGKSRTDSYKGVKFKVCATSVSAPYVHELKSSEYMVGEESVMPLSINASRNDSGDNITTTYQLYESDDGVTFTSINGATGEADRWGSISGQKYTPEVLTESGTRYYKLRVTNRMESYNGKTYTAYTDSNIASISFKTLDEMAGDEQLWDGQGTEASPYLIKNLEDLELLRKLVNEKGIAMKDCVFKMTQDIELPADWVPIGSLKPGASSTGSGTNIYPFSGTFDGGGYTLTVAKDGLPLLGYVRYAKVRKMNLYGEKIAGYGLVNNYCVDYGSAGDYGSYISGGYPLTIAIDNVTIKAGTQTLKAGFIGGYASGANVVEISNCTAEAGVVIGYNKDQTQIGSFAGNLSGTMDNCISYATVYGTTRVGGLAGSKGEAMGPSRVLNSRFEGTIEATGNYVGGIYGSGYTSTSAPNTPCISVTNCYVKADITGGNYVGGIVGAEPASLQCWANGTGYIQNNYFYGSLKATEENAAIGGVVGYMRSLDRYNVITNNYYLDTCGTAAAIAKADQIDTSVNVEREDATYVTTSSYCRDDDPLGADAEKLGKAATAAEFADGTVTDALNGGAGSNKNWTQGDKAPVFGAGSMTYVKSLSVSGQKTEYTTKEEFTTEGTTVTAVMSDGTVKDVDLKDVEFSGFINDPGTWTVTVTYEGSMTSFSVKVRNLTDEEIAAPVTEQIAALGEITLESRDSIEAARAAYDALDDDQKALVEDYDTLVKAEEKLTQLEKEAADMAEAKPVVDAITALGIITLESREAIEAARAAYEALSEEAKTMVTNLSDLVIAEKDLAVLEAKEKLEQAAKMRAFMTGSPEVEADAADKTIVVTWDAYADAKSYEVYRREGNQAAKCVAEVTGQSYTDSDISAGQTYTYTVRAVSDKWGETVYSEEAPEVTAGITLGKGTITRAQSWGYNAVKITWDQVEGADGYRLYCTDKPGSAWKYVTQIGKGDITSYVHKGRTTGTTYTYYMRAYRNVDGGKAFGAYSAGRNVKPVPKTTVISKVTGGSKAAAVSWNRVNGASGYRLYYKTSKAGSWKYVTQIGKGSTTTYTHKGLKTGQTVYYKMRAYRTVGGEKVFGAYSAERSVKVK